MDDHSPATKADIQQLRDEIGRSKEEIIRHFDVVAENLVKDFQDAFHDQTELLKDRQSDHERPIRRLERHLGLVM